MLCQLFRAGSRPREILGAVRRFGVIVAFAALAVALSPAAAGAATSTCRHWEGDPTTPCLVVTPTHGPIGTHVRFHGTIRADLISRYDDLWHNDPLYGLTGEFPASTRFPQGCELILPARGLRIGLDTGTGAVDGSFTVGARGTCSQDGGTSREGTTYAAMPGRYSLFIGSLSTYIASFHLTAGSAITTHSQRPAPATPPTHSHPKAVHPNRQPPPPGRLPFTGPPILQLTLVAAAAVCAGGALFGVPRAAPAGRHRAVSGRHAR